MRRRIDYVEPPCLQSRGRNGTMKSSGVEFLLVSEADDLMAGEACLRSLTGRGDVSDSARIVLTSEAAGEVAAAIVEFYARYASPDARQALANRLATICETGNDPQHDLQAPEPRDDVIPGRH